MPKKHLLYIHYDEFALVPKKSALVNELLGRYFEENPSSWQSSSEPVKIIKKAKEVPMSIKADYKPCKHGSHPEFCKFSRPGRPCK